MNELNTPSPEAKDLYFAAQYSQSFFGQFNLCFWKQWWTYWSSSHISVLWSLEQSFGRLEQNGMYLRYNYVRKVTVQNILLFGLTNHKNVWFSYFVWYGLIFSATKKELDYIYDIRDNSNDLFIVAGAFYGSVTFLGLSNCSTVQPVVAVERTVFYRERAAGLYSALPYVLAQVSPISLFHFILDPYCPHSNSLCSKAWRITQNIGSISLSIQIQSMESISLG